MTSAVSSQFLPGFFRMESYRRLNQCIDSLSILIHGHANGVHQGSGGVSVPEAYGDACEYERRLQLLNVHVGDGRHVYAHVRAPIPRVYASARVARSDAAIRRQPSTALQPRTE